MPHTNYTNPMGTQQESTNYTDPQSGGGQTWTYNGVVYDNWLDYMSAQAEDMTGGGVPGGRPETHASGFNELYDQWQNMQSMPFSSFNLPNPLNFLSWENITDATADTGTPDWTFDFTDVDYGTPTGMGGGRRPAGSASLLDYLVPSQLMTDIKATRAKTGDYPETMQQFYDKMLAGGQGFSAPPVYGPGGGMGPPAYHQWDDLTNEQKNIIQSKMDIAARAPSNIWSQEGVLGGMQTLGEKYLTGDWGIDPETNEPYASLTPESVRAFKPSDFAKLHPGYYTKSIMEPGREILETSLAAKLGQAATAGKGIAGYGRRGQLGEAAKTSYGRGVEDLYADVDVQRGGALQNIYDILGEWEGMSETYGG